MMILKVLTLTSLFIAFSRAGESAKAPRIRRVDYTPVKNAVAGEDMKLFCKVPKDTRNGRFSEYTWSKDGRILARSNHYKIRRFAFLKIRSVTVKDSGIYKCVVKNQYGSDSLTTKVKIILADPNPSEKCNLRFANPDESQELVAIIGNKINLDCSVKSCKFKSITWYHNGDKLDSEELSGKGLKKLRRNDQILTLQLVMPRDGGKYVCSISDGNVAINRTINVHPKQPVRTKPYIVSPKDNSTFYVRLGENSTVECVAFWSIHLQLLHVVKKHSTDGEDEIKVLQKPTNYFTEKVDYSNVILKTKAVFYFNNVSKDELGPYVCMAGNSFGFSSVSFSIQGHPR